MRGFLVRNRIRYIRDRAAAKFQAAWRGYWYRKRARDVMKYLALKRKQRERERCARTIQRGFRTALIRRRYLQIINAALLIQYWALSKIRRWQF